MKGLSKYILEKKTLIDFILEGQIDGLKDVKIIRHYTTGDALLSILDSGYIKAYESKGDADWKGYDIGEKKVVSFHDARTDPEWENGLKRNAENKSFEGSTDTLALNSAEICACIEIDYDKLDDLIKNKAHLLKIYDKEVNDFVNNWNKTIGNKDYNVNKYNGFCSAGEYLYQLIENKDNNEETYSTYENISKNLYSIYKYKDSKLIKDLLECFEKFLSNKELNATDRYGNKVSNSLIETILSASITKDKIDIDKLKTNIKEYKNYVKFFSKSNLTPFDDNERKELIEIVLKFDFISGIKLLRKHGWNSAYTTKMKEFNTGKTKELDRETEEYKDYSWNILFWLNDIMKNKDKIKKGDLEIRIASDVKIDKDNCKIIIFDGMCNATKQKKLKKLPAKYYEKYNIEHIKGKE